MTKGFTRAFLPPLSYEVERIHFHDAAPAPHLDMPRTTHDVVEDAVRAYRKTTIPNPMFSDYRQEGALWVPTNPYAYVTSSIMARYVQQLTMMPSSWTPYVWGGFDPVGEHDKPAPPPPEPKYEVNLMEALVGWKAWEVTDGRLTSASITACNWTPGEALEAVCKRYRGALATHTMCKISPREDCSCGIYGADERPDAYEYGDDPDSFVGLVYGWGRYVRGDSGWRAQYAYPSAFYIKPHQTHFLPVLCPFHVPIYIEQPTLIYNPEDDGYERRTDQEDWYRRATEVSTPAAQDGGEAGPDAGTGDDD